MRRWRIGFGIVAVLCVGLAGLPTEAYGQTESATYVGSQTCLNCHNQSEVAGAPDRSGWQETLHANLYRQPTAETVIGDFRSSPVQFKVGDATLTVSFGDGGGAGPWTMRLQGATFDTTLTVVRAHGGKEILANEDPVLPDSPGRRKWIGKQRYHAKIGNSYYILPAQWNPRPDRDGKNQGWVPYHPEHWMNDAGNWALGPNRSEELRCSGCHQVGPGPTVNAAGEYVLAKSDDTAFWNIGCESCHGPGSEHVAAGGQGAIVNPENLSVQRQNEVCGACHIRPKGHRIGGDNPGYPYSATLGRTYRPGNALADFIESDNGGYWPDGTSRQHHQQFSDYEKSAHFDRISCTACHTMHNETDAEHQLTVSARDNGLCVQSGCHSSYSNEGVVAAHTKHPVDLSSGLGRCVDCHMPAVQKSGVNYDIHAHTFKAISPQVTLDTQDEGGQPNSCAVSCHVDGLLGAPTFGIRDGSIGKWNEASDVALAKRLLQPSGGVVVERGPVHRAVVVATVTRDGSPVAGAEVSFARAISGRRPLYRWAGTTDASGRAEIEIVAESAQFWRTGATGYYLARAKDAAGAVIGKWGSIPIRGGKEVAVSLPIGGLASVETGETLTFALAPAWPNPFNPSTQIGYQIPEPGEVNLAVYNALGQEVKVLVRDYMDAGRYQVTWDGTDAYGHPVASGMYIYRLMSQGQMATGRMLLLK